MWWSQWLPDWKWPLPLPALFACHTITTNTSNSNVTTSNNNINNTNDTTAGPPHQQQPTASTTAHRINNSPPQQQQPTASTTAHRTNNSPPHQQQPRWRERETALTDRSGEGDEFLNGWVAAVVPDRFSVQAHASSSRAARAHKNKNALAAVFANNNTTGCCLCE